MPPSDEFDAVASDLPLAMRKLLTGLTKMGYRRIGFAGWIEEGNNDRFAEIRCRTYIDWMKAHAAFDPRICADAT